MPGLYLHIPFCEKKCVYCDFYSIEKTSLMDDFLDALCDEMNIAVTHIAPREDFSSVFLGGGTPSLMTPIQLEKVLTTLHQNYAVMPDAEITMECNPGTVHIEKLRGYKALGINRLSFGVQSFHADELAFLHRIHTADETRDGIRMAQKAGFDNINIDLMFALPMHTKERLAYTLRETIALEPKHISAYSLIYEEGTPLFTQLQHHEVTPIDEALDAELFLFTSEFLSANGYVQYEVSNFAKRRAGGGTATEDELYACRHNLNYWHCGEYLSFGPSAHSFWRGERQVELFESCRVHGCTASRQYPGGKPRTYYAGTGPHRVYFARSSQRRNFVAAFPRIV